MATLDIEKKFLSYCLNDAKYMETAFNKVRVEFLSDAKSAIVYEILYNYYEKYIELPTKLAYITILKHKFIDSPNEVDWYIAYGTQLKNTQIVSDGADFQFVLDNIVDSYMRDYLIENIGKTVDTIDKKNVKEIYSELGERIDSALSIDEQENIKTVDVGTDWRRVLNFYDVKKKEKGSKAIMGISTGITELDRVTGGWRPGELVVIMGSAGQGKSAIMLNLANNGWMAGYNVLFITLEMHWEEIFDRRHSMLTGLPYFDIRNRNLTPEVMLEYCKQMGFSMVAPDKQIEYLKMFDEKFKDINTFKINELEEEIEKLEHKTNKFRILDISTNCTVRMINEHVTKMMKTGGLDLVVIDYINIMTPSMNTGDNWFNYGAIARELKMMARNKKFTVITAAQMGEIKKNEKITTQNIKYAKMIGDNADYVIGFTIEETDKANNVIRLQMAKHRSTTGQIISIKQYFDRMKIDNYHEV